MAVLPVLASLSALGAATTTALPSSIGCVHAAATHHAALIVEHADGAVTSLCVAFGSASITGEQLLAASGVEYATAVFGGAGDAVCQIDHEPPQYPSTCWTSSSPYWAMYVSRGGGPWAFSNLGVSGQTFQDGDAQGFRYESQSGGPAPASPHGVCPVVTAPSPTPSSAATAPARPAGSRPATLTPTPARRRALAPPAASAATPAAPAPVAAAAPPTTLGALSTTGPSPIPAPGTATVAALPPTPAGMGSPSGAVWAAAALALLLAALAAVRLSAGRRGAAGKPGPRRR